MPWRWLKKNLTLAYYLCINKYILWIYCQGQFTKCRSAGLNSEFSFSKTGCLTKAKVPILPYYLLIDNLCLYCKLKEKNKNLGKHPLKYGNSTIIFTQQFILILEIHLIPFFPFSVVYTLCLRLFPGEHNWQMMCIPIAEALSAFLIPFAVKPFQSQVFIKPEANITTLANCTIDTCYITASKIAYPYVFTAIILFPAICAFAYYSFHEKCSNKIEEEYDRMPDSQTWSTAKWKENWAIIVLLFFFHIPVFGSIIAFSDLLTLYGSSAPLFLDKGTMAYMTSMFWGCLLIGRLANMVLSKYVHMGVLLCINFGGLVIFTCLLIGPQNNTAYLWVGTAGFGIFQSSFLPSVITWAGSFLHLDSIVLNVSLLASGIGEVVIPYVAAMIFQNFGHSSLMFLIFIFSITEVILFSGISFIHWLHKKQNITVSESS